MEESNSQQDISEKIMERMHYLKNTSKNKQSTGQQYLKTPFSFGSKQSLNPSPMSTNTFNMQSLRPVSEQEEIIHQKIHKRAHSSSEEDPGRIENPYTVLDEVVAMHKQRETDLLLNFKEKI